MAAIMLSINYLSEMVEWTSLSMCMFLKWNLLFMYVYVQLIFGMVYVFGMNLLVAMPKLKNRGGRGLHFKTYF